MRILSEIMLKTRARCPCCGTRLNEEALDREIDLTDERDVMEQEIGGYGGISSGSTSSFENYPEIAQYFLENVNLAKEYLEEILEIEDEETDEDE
ncbi:MAG: hypothetical protein HOC31_01620 [Nitrosopumilus sp.]|jgi:hypothetical protein|nr:hypothetical protein [Nitrosopumilus sp.]